MKTLYALVLVCMSAPTLAFGCQFDPTDYEIDENATVLAPEDSIEVGADFFVNEIAAQLARKVEPNVEIGADEIAAPLTHKVEQNDVDGHAIKVDHDYTASTRRRGCSISTTILVDSDPDF